MGTAVPTVAQNLSYSYNENGTDTVTLTVTDGDGAEDSISKAVTINCRFRWGGVCYF